MPFEKKTKMQGQFLSRLQRNTCTTVTIPNNLQFLPRSYKRMVTTPWPTQSIFRNSTHIYGGATSDDYFVHKLTDTPNRAMYDEQIDPKKWSYLFWKSVASIVFVGGGIVVATTISSSLQLN